jgi:hypothetical protein
VVVEEWIGKKWRECSGREEAAAVIYTGEYGGGVPPMRGKSGQGGFGARQV